MEKVKAVASIEHYWKCPNCSEEIHQADKELYVYCYCCGRHYEAEYEKYRE